MGKTKNKTKIFLSLHQKAKIVEDYQNGITVTALSKKYGVAKSTICAINNKKDRIINAISHILKPNRMCTLKTSMFPKMEKKLYRWFLQQRERHIPVAGDTMKQKALNLFSSLNLDKNSNIKFNASNGWLQRFKCRYGIRFLKVTGEKLSSQPELVDHFKEKLAKLVEEFGFCEDQLYNADETGLYWKILPEKTAPGVKIAKQRFTFLGCANATGLHKLKEFVIGKSKNPQCFRNFKNPTIYKNTKNAWMTGEIFKRWFFQHFVPEVKGFLCQQGLSEKAVLLLDNAPSRPPEEKLKTEDGMIFVMFMPPNVTPLIQPMDQIVLRLTKLYYRKSSLNSIMPNSQYIGEELKKLTLKDAIIHLHSAWETITPKTISKCWRNLLSSCEFTIEDNMPLSQLKKDDNVESVISETVTLLKTIRADHYTESEVLEWNLDNIKTLDDNSEHDDDVLEEDLEHNFPKIKHDEAIQALKVALEWAQQNDVEISDILSIKKVYGKAVLYNSAKKTKTDKNNFIF